ncbi:MAG: DUF2071 domain-containing protein [Pirellulales bacterium]
MKRLQFEPGMLAKRPATGLDVETVLSHFAIITYLVEPDLLRTHMHPRFEPDCITSPDGGQQALISVVPFVDRDFRFVRCPWPKWSFGQTNYRAYVTDTETGEHVAWFFGTSLASFTVNIPRFAWKLPWHNAQIRFQAQYDTNLGRYTEYRMTTRSEWAPAELELEDSGRPPRQLSGFPDLESGLVLLTHPMRGYFYRRDGKLGSYSIWHDQLQTTEGRVIRANFPLLQQLDLVQEGDISAIHSVLMQPETKFTIYLPPVAV